jgi:hypothetical protein
VVTAFPGTYPLGRIAPAPLNIATALHAEAMGGHSMTRNYFLVVFSQDQQS